MKKEASVFFRFLSSQISARKKKRLVRSFSVSPSFSFRPHARAARPNRFGFPSLKKEENVSVTEREREKDAGARTHTHVSVTPSTRAGTRAE